MNTDILNDPDLQNMVSNGPPGPAHDQQLTMDLTQLCNFGAIEETLTVGPYTFLIKTLSAGEQEKCLASIVKYNIASLVVAAALQNQVLARGIVSVNGVPLENVPFDRDSVADEALLAAVDRGDTHASRLAVVLSWQDGLRQQLFQFHQDLSTRSEGIFSGVSADDLKE